MNSNKFHIYAKSIVIALTIFLANQAHSSEIRIDLSNQIKSETSSQVVDASKKAELGMQWLKAANELEIFNFLDLYEFEINSYKYENNSLTVNIRATINPEKSNYIIEKFRFINNFSIRQIQDKRLSINSTDSNPRGYNGLLTRSLSYLVDLSIFNNQVATVLKNDKGDSIASQNISESDLKSLTSNWYNIASNANAKEQNFFESKLIFKISKQDALKIKTIKIEKTKASANEKSLVAIANRWISDLSPISILESLLATNPLASYEIARDSSIVNLLAQYEELRKTADSRTSAPHLALESIFYYITAKFNIADNVFSYLLYQNTKNPAAQAFVADHISEFTVQNFDEITSKRKKFSPHSGVTQTASCEKYVPRNHPFATPNTFLTKNERIVYFMMNKLAMKNDVSVLADPNKSIRVIVGSIETLTNDGGIIGDAGINKNQNPVVYTKTAKSIVINPEKIAAKTVTVRIVGTYENNTKVSFSNRTGGKRTVDAPDISVICMEPLYTDFELMDASLNK